MWGKVNQSPNDGYKMDDDPICGIYRCVNQINQKPYTGQARDIVHRWGEHKRGPFTPSHANDCPYFYKAIRKYGVGNFEFEIICELDSDVDQNILDTMEIFYIDQLGTYECRETKTGWGYNMDKGGKGCSGYKHTKENKERMSKRVSGEGNPMYGTTRSPETIAKLKSSLKLIPPQSKKTRALRSAKFKGSKNPMYGKASPISKPIWGKRKTDSEWRHFRSMSKAGEYFGLSGKTIGRYLKNNKKHKLFDFK